LNRDFADSWIDLGSVEGDLYSVSVRAASKSSVWYSPKQFADNGWEIPKTWAEMVALSDIIVEDGKQPWSIALESGAASGWPATDWVQEIFIHDHGPDLYDLWVNHEIPWTHPAVRSSFEKFGSVALKPGT
jgi:alpha-glucoside transport system substrate-binding protein